MKTIFIIPYRNRESELQLWLNKMIIILDKQFNCININYEDKPYEVIIIHQKDDKLFNKGACINTATQIIKKKYLNSKLKLSDITIIIHDVDIYITNSKVIEYKTNIGEVINPYGPKPNTLGLIFGCIVICNLQDYININGIPNYWGWGGEDICLAKRFKAHNIKINTDKFIERYTSNDIIDPRHTISIKQQKFQQITDKKNLRECFLENSLKSINGISNCSFQLLNEYYVNNYTQIKNVKMYDVLINII